MTDITELAQSLKAAAIDAKELAIIARYSKGRAAAEKFYALANPNNVIALVEALEKSEKTSEARREAIDRTHNMFVRERDRANAAEEALEKGQEMIAFQQGEIKALLSSLESRTVTIEPFRSFVTDADLAALHRFVECCDDPESGGHDLEKEQVRRLESIGALQRSGRISYITGFGDFLISITAAIKWESA